MIKYAKIIQTVVNNLNTHTHACMHAYITKYYKSSQMITTNCKSLQIIANHYKPLQITTNHYKLLHIITHYDIHVIHFKTQHNER